jgi:protein SERAC1
MHSVILVHGLFGHPFETWSSPITSSPELPTKEGGIGAGKSNISKLAQRIFRTERRLKEQETESDYSGPSISEDQVGKQAKRTKNFFWPRDLLPTSLPTARIFTWGYDVDIANLFGRTSQESIYEHANVLLSDLADSRTSPEEKVRPIIFLAHSLGGIVVKDALCRSSRAKSHLNAIFPATLGIIFLGTPHRGSETASLGTIDFEISKLFFKKPDIQVLRALEVNSETLDRIDTTFREIISERSIKIYSFRETLLSKGGVLVVQQHSYRLGVDQEVTNVIPADHRNMVKFRWKDDPGYKRVAAVLKRWVDDIGSAITGTPF